MPESLNFSADVLLMSPRCRRRHLHINHADAKPMRDHFITLASICDVWELCEVERRDPTMHVLIFTLEGQGRLYTSDFAREGAVMSPGQLVVLPAHLPHQYHLDAEHWQALWIYLADVKIWGHLRQQRSHIRLAQTAREILAAMEGFLAESIRVGARARVAARHYAELIVLNLERELEVEENLSAQKMRQELVGLWEAVRADLARPWRVSDLAEQIDISPQHLYRVSQRFCACKPMEMVKRLRMERAQDMLSSTDHPVKIVAQQVGYGDAFSFSAAFKRQIGCSPRAFRNRHLRQVRDTMNA